MSRIQAESTTAKARRNCCGFHRAVFSRKPSRWLIGVLQKLIVRGRRLPLVSFRARQPRSLRRRGFASLFAGGTRRSRLLLGLPHGICEDARGHDLEGQVPEDHLGPVESNERRDPGGEANKDEDAG